MEAAEAKVQRILEGTRQFLVPHFQRPYSWREKHWETLWRDLSELVQDPNSKPHFLGSIVSAPARSVPEGVEKRLLIDGQQRLTTILVMLAIVRDRAASVGNEKLAERIGDLIANRHESGSDRYKLLPTQGDSPSDGDRDAFIGLIDRRVTESVSGIQEARAYFSNKLQRADAPNLDDLFRVMTAKLTLVSIILDEKDNPHRIFESLNGKGRPLSQTDLIRNYFFMRLPESEHEPVYRTVWQPMQKRLGEELLTEFVRHYLMHFGAVVNESDIYATLKERIETQSQSAMEHLTELAEYSKHYELLIKPEKAAAGLQERLKRLGRLEVTVAYPFLLPTYADFVGGALTEAQLLEVFDVVETYVVRRFVCGVATHGLNKIFTPLYQQSKKQPDFVSAVKTILSDRACPRDEQFREGFNTARLYGGGERREKTKLLLERLEVALGHKEKVDSSNLTIEHVMPQTLTPWWKEQLGEDWEDDHETLLHTLGNLTLTGYNSELSNQSYPEKRAEFAKSHFGLNRYFADVERWDSAEIERRADSLVDLALTVWPYFGQARAGEIAPSESADVTSTLPRLIRFRGHEHSVRSWVEVLVVTLEQIIADAPDEFVRVELELARVVNRDPTQFKRARRLRRLSNGAYVEANLSASAIHRVCLQAIQVVGLGPDEWSVDFVSLAGGEDGDHEDPPSEAKQLQLRFWERVRGALVATSKFPSLRAPRGRYWYDVAIGRSGFWLSLNANVAQGKVQVKLVVNSEDVGEAIGALSKDRSAVEREIGTALEWDPHPEKKFRTIRLVHSINISDRETWPAAIEWVVNTAVAFKDAFAGRIANLELS